MPTALAPKSTCHPTGRCPAFARFSGARSGLLTTDDVVEAAGVIEPGKAAAVLVYENAWAIPFVAAARGEDGQMVASARLSAQDIMDALGCRRGG